MYITAGLFNMLLKQFENIEIDIPKILSEFKTDSGILQSPLSRIDAGILGRYFEHIVIKTNNHRIGLEAGFALPFVITGAIFNICRNKSTIHELFSNPIDFVEPTANDIHEFVIREENDLVYFEICVNDEFAKAYPIATRQWIEMQYGIALQYAYSFTGRILYPVFVHSIYPKEGVCDKLEEYISCPIQFGQAKVTLAYNKTISKLPIVTPNSELLAIFTDYIREIQILEEQENIWTNSVWRYLIHTLSVSNLSLDFVAERFNMSKRTIHRKLKEEGTSYQHILDGLRMELAQKYLKEKISLTEIAFLLGFESQSAFNKFFRKHFNSIPSLFR